MSMNGKLSIKKKDREIATIPAVPEKLPGTPGGFAVFVTPEDEGSIPWTTVKQ